MGALYKRLCKAPFFFFSNPHPSPSPLLFVALLFGHRLISQGARRAFIERACWVARV
jgi:hypothetical protein